jgi:hypothetical protein
MTKKKALHDTISYANLESTIYIKAVADCHLVPFLTKNNMAVSPTEDKTESRHFDTTQAIHNIIF